MKNIIICTVHHKLLKYYNNKGEGVWTGFIWFRTEVGDENEQEMFIPCSITSTVLRIEYHKCKMMDNRKRDYSCHDNLTNLFHLIEMSVVAITIIYGPYLFIFIKFVNM